MPVFECADYWLRKKNCGNATPLFTVGQMENYAITVVQFAYNTQTNTLQLKSNTRTKCPSIHFQMHIYYVVGLYIHLYRVWHTETICICFVACKYIGFYIHMCVCACVFICIYTRTHTQHTFCTHFVHLHMKGNLYITISATSQQTCTKSHLHTYKHKHKNLQHNRFYILKLTTTSLTGGQPLKNWFMLHVLFVWVCVFVVSAHILEK